MLFELEKNLFEYTAKKSAHLDCPAHLHQQTELILVLEGEATAYADGAEYTLKKGDLFIVFPNQIHCYEVKTDTLRHIRVIFLPDMCAEFSQVFKTYIPETAVIKNQLHLQPVMERIVSCKKSGDTYALTKTRGCLLIMLSDIIPSLSLCERVGVETDTVTQIINYCCQNHDTDITLSRVAQALHINKFYVSRLFSTRLKVGFREYINSIRITHACELLASNDASISEIAYAVGYNSIRTFNRAFGNVKGITPREYRNLKRSE